MKIKRTKNNLIECARFHRQLFITPNIGIVITNGVDYPWKVRLVVSWLIWGISIGLTKYKDWGETK